MTSAEPVIMCHSLVKVYESALGRVQAVRGVDLAVERGATAAIVGPSGSGKSSLLRMLAGLDRPTAGFVHVDGYDLHAMRPGKRARARSRLVTHVHQRPSDNLLAHLTALEQLERLTTQGGLALEALATLGVDDRAGHFPAELSGGEQQRLAFARALVTGSPVVIADEPTATLDTGSASVVLDAVDTLAARGITVIIATHDARVLGRMSEIVALRDGAVASITSGSTEMAVIDRSGRIQLPPALRERFPGDRALLGWDDEGGQMTVTPP